MPSPYHPQHYSPYINPFVPPHMPLLQTAQSMTGFGANSDRKETKNPNETPKRGSNKTGAALNDGFGPSKVNGPADTAGVDQGGYIPYRAPSFVPQMASVSRAQTLPDLDDCHVKSNKNSAKGGIYNAPPLMPLPSPYLSSPYVATPQPPLYSPYLYHPPVFRDDTEIVRGPAPGPDRHSRRGRRSEGGHLLRKQLFHPEPHEKAKTDGQLVLHGDSSHSQQKKKNSVQIADDDGIVNRLLGPVDNSQ